MANQQAGSSSLLRQLVFNAIVSVSVPVVFLSLLTFFILAYHLDIIETSFTRSRDAITNDVARVDLISQSVSTARQIDAFLIERITEAKTWANSPIIIDAAREAHQIHTKKGFVGTPITEIEKNFTASKTLAAFPEADSYLRSAIASSPYFAEIFFTDVNGFNVALTNPTSDFVQSDENWWQRAFSQSFYASEVKYDNSAGVWAVEIAIRIDDSNTNTPLGVMKSVLAIEPIQKIADWTVQTNPSGRVYVVTGEGVLIAETSSDHARERIMNTEITLLDWGGPSVRSAFGSERSGFTADSEWLTGYAHSGAQNTQTSLTDKFLGFGWIIILQKPLKSILEPLSALNVTETTLHSWRWELALMLGVMTVLSTVCAVAMAASIARKYASSLQTVRDLAHHAAQGENFIATKIEGPEEFVQLNESVLRLSQASQSTIRRSQSRDQQPLVD